MAKKQRSSTNSERHPYLKLGFWENPSNKFWNSETHTEKSSDHFNNWLSDWRSRERLYVSL